MREVLRTLGAVAGLVLVPIGVAFAGEGDISLITGGGGPGHGGDGGPAIAAQLTFPEDCETAPDGVMYVAEDGRVRRIGNDGIITTLIGDVAAGQQSVRPAALAVDPSGTLYVADFASDNPRVIAVTPSGAVERIAGTGLGAGYSGDGGPADQAAIGQPLSLALTGDALYFTDAQLGIVRRVDLDTRTILTVPQLAGAYELAAGPSGEIYASYLTSHTVSVLDTGGELRPVAGVGTAGFSGDGFPATSAALNTPVALAVDAAGTVFISDAGNNRIRRIGPDGLITTIAGTGMSGTTGDDGPALAATFVFPRGLGIDVAGGLCIADTGGNVVRLIEGAAIMTPAPTTLPPTTLPPTTSTVPNPSSTVPIGSGGVRTNPLPETGGRSVILELGLAITALGAVLLAASSRRHGTRRAG